MHHRLEIKDYMTIGVYAALYFLLVALGTLVGLILFRSGHATMAPLFSTLFAALPYMVMVDKTRKFLAISLMSTVMALFFLLTGHFALSFLPSLICGFLADITARIGHYRKPIWNLLSYIVFSFGNLGPVILMWVARDAYIARLLEKGKDMNYIQNVMVSFDLFHVLWLMIGMTLMGALGALFAQYVIRKHMRKAGL